MELIRHLDAMISNPHVKHVKRALNRLMIHLCDFADGVVPYDTELLFQVESVLSGIDDVAPRDVNKVIFLGEPGVGKTSLIRTFIGHGYDSQSKSTGKMQYGQNHVFVGSYTVNLSLVDRPKKLSNSATASFYAHASAAVFAFDVTDRQSLDGLAGWMEELIKYRDDKPMMMLFGCKIDSDRERVVSTAEGRELAVLHNMTYVETSAKMFEDKNIVRAFRKLATEIVYSQLFKLVAGMDKSKWEYSQLEATAMDVELGLEIPSADAESPDAESQSPDIETLLFLTHLNPKYPTDYIRAARSEEIAGNHATAREMIAKGCAECPKSEDVWLESARLNTMDVAKVILAQAVLHVPESAKIWLRAAELETDTKSKKLVLTNALEHASYCSDIWKAALGLEEDPEDARSLLYRAMECIPLSVELWLALARLESYDNAKNVLNKARSAHPKAYEVWVSAARLEEVFGDVKMVEKIINRAVAQLATKG
ncbi:Ras- protein Rab6, partial [Rhizophlyctis rosea]